MMPTSELITVLRTCAQGLDHTVRFLILDACDRLERKTKDNELLAQKIVEMRSRTVKTNADRIRAMTDKELAAFLAERFARNTMMKDEQPMTATHIRIVENAWYVAWMQWLHQPAGDDV